MKDKQFLLWLHDRIIEVYGEEVNMDFMFKLRNIILDYPEDKMTPNVTYSLDYFNKEVNK